MVTAVVDPYIFLPVCPPDTGTLKCRGGFQSIMNYILVSGTGPVAEIRHHYGRAAGVDVQLLSGAVGLRQ